MLTCELGYYYPVAHNRELPRSPLDPGDLLVGQEARSWARRSKVFELYVLALLLRVPRRRGRGHVDDSMSSCTPRTSSPLYRTRLCPFFSEQCAVSACPYRESPSRVPIWTGKNDWMHHDVHRNELLRREVEELKCASHSTEIELQAEAKYVSRMARISQYSTASNHPRR